MNSKTTKKKKCQEMLQYPGIRFVGIINQLGNLVAGGSKHGVESYATEQQRRVLFMQLVLEYNMRSELNHVLGPIRNIVVTRGKVKKITIPLGKKILVISLEPDIDAEEVTNKANKIFEVR